MTHLSFTRIWYQINTSNIFLYFIYYCLFLPKREPLSKDFSKNIPATSSAGNMMAARIPFFKSSEAMPEIYPTSVGPPEHPRSPARASRANSAVPPFLMEAAPLLKLPGHIIPTDNPQMPQPKRDRSGEGEREIHRYDIIQRMPLAAINLSRSILSPYFP